VSGDQGSSEGSIEASRGSPGVLVGGILESHESYRRAWQSCSGGPQELSRTQIPNGYGRVAKGNLLPAHADDPGNCTSARIVAFIRRGILETMKTDKYGNTWDLPENELCSECGQPELVHLGFLSCRDCNHHPLNRDEVLFLGGIPGTLKPALGAFEERHGKLPKGGEILAGIDAQELWYVKREAFLEGWEARGTSRTAKTPRSG
jgi:hypothetical protein